MKNLTFLIGGLFLMVGSVGVAGAQTTMTTTVGGCPAGQYMAGSACVTAPVDPATYCVQHGGVWAYGMCRIAGSTSPNVYGMPPSTSTVVMVATSTMMYSTTTASSTMINVPFAYCALYGGVWDGMNCALHGRPSVATTTSPKVDPAIYCMQHGGFWTYAGGCQMNVTSTLSTFTMPPQPGMTDDRASACSGHGGFWDGVECHVPGGNPAILTGIPMLNTVMPSVMSTSSHAEDNHMGATNSTGTDNSATVASLQQQVKMLMEQLSNLMKAQAGNGESSSGPGNSGTSATGTKPAMCAFGAMKQGDTSDQVRALQMLLVSEGDFKGTATGFFGPKTMRALKQYQSDNGVSSTGFVDSSTVSLLNSSAREDFSACRSVGDQNTSSSSAGTSPGM